MAGVIGFSITVTPATAYAQSVTEICAQAEADAAKDIKKRKLWFGVGGIFGSLGVTAAAFYLPPVLSLSIGFVGIVVADVYEPCLPVQRLVGKSPEYVETYAKCYKSSMKKLQVKSATIGCLTGGILTAGFYFLLALSFASTMGDSF